MEQQVKKGQVILPTGTGKTYIQIATIVKNMVDKANKGTVGNYVIAAHRIILCRQLLGRIIIEINRCGLNFDILSIGSDRLDGDNDVYRGWLKDKNITALDCRILSTTSSEEITVFLKQASILKRHVVIASTYHSIETLLPFAEKNPIDTMLCDEAHTTIGKSFNKSIEKFINFKATQAVYYFTATPKFRGMDRGMHNEKTYGEVLYWKSLREMVDRMEIVRPKLHFVEYTGNAHQSIRTLACAIKEAFIWHRKRIRARTNKGNKNLHLNEKVGAKVLISCNGIPQLLELFNCSWFQDFCKMENVKVCLFSSKCCAYGDSATGFKVDVPRKDVYNKMMNLKDEEDAILLHVNILTEGIDVPAITGVLPLRALETVSLLQTCGRAARLLKSDRNRIYHKSEPFINPSSDPEENKKKMDWLIKPTYNLILFKNVLDTLDTNLMKKILKDMMAAYEMSYEEMLEEDDFFGDEKDPPDVITNQFTNNFSSFKTLKSEEFKQWEEEIRLMKVEDALADFSEGKEKCDAIIELLTEN
jgi:DNA or RNA helicases of superfamily II